MSLKLTDEEIHKLDFKRAAEDVIDAACKLQRDKIAGWAKQEIETYEVMSKDPELMDHSMFGYIRAMKILIQKLGG